MNRRKYQVAAVFAALISAITFLSLGHVTFAQEEVSQAVSDEQSAVGEQAVSDQPVRREGESQNIEGPEIVDPDDEKEQLRKSAFAGLLGLSLVLSLICIVFLVLIVLVALWARRIRRLASQPLPDQHPGDPLWYLRKGKGSDSPDVVEFSDDSSSQSES